MSCFRSQAFVAASARTTGGQYSGGGDVMQPARPIAAAASTIDRSISKTVNDLLLRALRFCEYIGLALLRLGLAPNPGKLFACLPEVAGHAVGAPRDDDRCQRAG